MALLVPKVNNSFQYLLDVFLEHPFDDNDGDDDEVFTEMHGCSLSNHEYLRAPISE